MRLKLINIVFCSLLNIPNWLQNHLITCPFKKLTGIDCPGCGFQRSVLELLRGNLGSSFILYPATIPLLIACLLSLADHKLRFDKKDILKKSVYIFTGTTIIVSYIFKISTLYIIH